MKKPISMGEKLRAKLVKLGLPARKATEVAKGLTPLAQRATVSGTVTQKLVAKLLKLGVSERKATTLAKGLAPLVRAAIKVKVKKAAITLDDVTDDMVNTAVSEATDAVDDAELDNVAPRVNGHRLRLDLPVAPMQGLKGIEILRVMDGLTSSATYLVAAVKGDAGIVAVRRLSADDYNVKFYPSMAYWNTTASDLQPLGAHRDTHLTRAWYERLHFTQAGTEAVLKRLAKDVRPAKTALVRRFLTITGSALFKGFSLLVRRVGQAA